MLANNEIICEVVFKNYAILTKTFLNYVSESSYKSPSFQFSVSYFTSNNWIWINIFINNSEYVSEKNSVVSCDMFNDFELFDWRGICKRRDLQKDFKKSLEKKV
jgi:hypothetical protein